MIWFLCGFSYILVESPNIRLIIISSPVIEPFATLYGCDTVQRKATVPKSIADIYKETIKLFSTIYAAAWTK